MVLAVVSCRSSVQQRVDPQPQEIPAIHRLWIGGADGQCVADVVAAIRSGLPQVTLVQRPEWAEAILLVNTSVSRMEGLPPAQDGCEPCRAARGERTSRPVLESRSGTAHLLIPDGSGSYRAVLRVEAGEGAATPLGRRLGERFVRAFTGGSSEGRANREAAPGDRH